jgi:hypothetical protein
MTLKKSYSYPEFRNRLLSKFPYSEYFQLQNIYEQGKRSKKDKLNLPQNSIIKLFLMIYDISKNAFVYDDKETPAKE